MRVLGVDPGLTRCGIGVIDSTGGRGVAFVAVDVVRTSADEPLAQRDARKTEPFGLGIQRGALGLPLGVELILQVFEEAIPAHPATL